MTELDPEEDFQLEEEDQDIDEEESEPEEDDSDAIQVGQSQAEEPTETPVGVADDEQVASRTRSQTATDEPIAARTRQAPGSDPEMSAFADVKDKMVRGYLPGVQEDVGHRCVDVKRRDHPNDHRLVGCRWVFKVKRNGVHHARLVAKGFSQIPGMDFTDNYSPVVNDVTFSVVVARMLIENLKGKAVDIDNEFLNGDLEHEIYMKIPEGYDEVINKDVDKEDCLILQEAIYGLVQAPSQLSKKLVDKMQEQGFQLSEADPCMLHKDDERGVCIIISMARSFSIERTNKFGRFF